MSLIGVATARSRERDTRRRSSDIVSETSFHCFLLLEVDLACGSTSKPRHLVAFL
jgi:hypothetical protein